MPPVHEVLNRIRWDSAFAAGRYSLAYVDQRRAEPVVVPFSVVRFDAGASRMIELVDSEGESRKIPVRRIRQVLKDGVVIWECGVLWGQSRVRGR